LGDGPVNFDPSTARRILRAVRFVERNLGLLLGRRMQRPEPPPGTILFQFTGPLSGQNGWYNANQIIGRANSISNASSMYSSGSWQALPTSPPSGGGLYSGQAIIVYNPPDASFRDSSGNPEWPVPSNAPGFGAILGTSGSGDSPANTMMVLCLAVGYVNCNPSG